MPAKSIYNIDTLNEFCLQNELNLLDKYEEVNRDTKIEGYCKTHNCNGTYKKAFRMLSEHKNFYCQPCLKVIKNNKMKQTCLEKYGHVTNLLVEEIKTKSHSEETMFKRKQTNIIKYGSEYPSQNESVKQKMRKSIYEKFGVEYASQNKDVQTKRTQTNLLKYGVEYTSQNEEIKNKIKATNIKRFGETAPAKNKCIQQKIENTNLQRYGYKCALQNKDVQTKRKQTNLLKYGVEYPSQNQEVKNKVKQTCLERFGVEYALQSEEVKHRGKQTSLQKYGYEHYQHNKIVSENASKKAYKLKTFITPSGKEIMCQGYEHFAIKHLINDENINEQDMLTERIDVPEFWYNDKNHKKHRHYVDIFIKSLNKCLTRNISVCNIIIKNLLEN